MTDSPTSATPYEVLGVPATASHDELRRAYKRLLRTTHPDVGGDAGRFIAVQQAWERVATPEDRAAYDRGSSRESDQREAWAQPAGGAPRRDSRPTARSYGHPGGWRRERYLQLMREWVGRGVELDDPYDPALVRTAPWEIRHTLADALAEEATARQLATLGIGYTVWHDVDSGRAGEKIDHVVLGPTGLFAILSEDFGGEVRTRRGELIGESLAGEEPIRSLAVRAKALTRATRVKFSALLVVLPDDALAEPLLEVGSVRGALTAAVRHSVLPSVLRAGLPGTRQVGGVDIFDVRTKLQSAIRFV
ncbi:nuclease-like protein [Diaminobutyricimonas aerilata]|uniref:Nuclease-like protein n=1 Tax=Diaminobutyricimonas aerilata TaxID=1162967 RepID=A0A2M9CL36_9MICO|nr:DnaJ domain-containing protein [Diaminobutyricimonas aerilata]PJJ72605.1 nuclease-like protein [Diaminobutyricimonas aerilata]